VKKRFGFSLDTELHAELQARAEAEGTSMAAICREALLLHLQKPALNLPLPPRADTTGPGWGSLKQGVRDYLGRQEFDESLEELEDFLSEPFQPKHTPDLFYSAERRRRTTDVVSSYNPPPRARARVDDYGTRWLDELWA
jgi:ribbon-helix-helix CopG family protein